MVLRASVLVKNGSVTYTILLEIGIKLGKRFITSVFKILLGQFLSFLAKHLCVTSIMKISRSGSHCLPTSFSFSRSSSPSSDSLSEEQSELYSSSSEFCAKKEGSRACTSPHTRSSNAASSNSLSFRSSKTTLAGRESAVTSRSAKAGSKESQSWAPILSPRALISSVVVDWSGSRICFWAYHAKLMILRCCHGVTR